MKPTLCTRTKQQVKKLKADETAIWDFDVAWGWVISRVIKTSDAAEWGKHLDGAEHIGKMFDDTKRPKVKFD